MDEGLGALVLTLSSSGGLQLEDKLFAEGVSMSCA
jgi:hypothetical protein